MDHYKLAIIGLGYVGLPLASEFAKPYSVIGFDVNEARVSELRSGYDRTLEIANEVIQSTLKQENDNSAGLFVTSSEIDLQEANVYIVTVPTPVDRYQRPDLSALKKASTTVSLFLQRDNIVVYESTVYPGVTEDICVPILEAGSGLTLNKDFFVGYSPERINPGDKEHTLTNVVKVISGSSPQATQKINDLYRSIIKSGTHVTPSIKVAEAAKVIENAQRDINIAFMNELAKIFRYLDLDTTEVLQAAGTKWNFLPFTPGLVGGHCIGVDPYYLAQKAIEVGYHPEIILSGRRLNDGMGAYVAGEVIKLMVKKQIPLAGSRALVMGITFKENCTDVRNTKVIDIITQLQGYHIDVDVYDPWADPDVVLRELGVRSVTEPPVETRYNAVVVAVAHREFTEAMIEKISCNTCVIFDVKSILRKGFADARL